MILISTGSIAIFAAIAIVVLLVMFFISAQRRLVSADEICGNSLSQIGVQQNSRWDALTALAELTKGYSKHEHDTLMDVISQRRAVNASTPASEVDAQENMLTEAMGKIMAISESYPDLKANTIYIQTMGNVKEFENNVRYARMTFNDSVTKLNRLVRQFPTNLAAALFGFKRRDYLAEDVSKASMPSMGMN